MVTIHDLGEYTFSALLRNTLEKFGERPALSLVHGEPITYHEFQLMMKKLARVMTANGFAPGKKVAIFGQGMPQWGGNNSPSRTSGYDGSKQGPLSQGQGH